ncbi:MAG: cadmium-translocating P-type ATPase, partial [Clostridiales bacterium]|nr:cadmium-translocating P-type ATPase [Clostridiales bacterium]
MLAKKPFLWYTVPAMVKIYKISGLDCANCAAKIEKAVNGLQEVERAEMNFPAERLTVTYADGADYKRAYLKIVKIVDSIEEGVTLADAQAAEEHGRAARRLIFNAGNAVKLSGVILFLVAAVLQFTGEGEHGFGETDFVWTLWAGVDSAREAVGILLYYASFLLCGYEILYIFGKRIRSARFLDENFLMTIVGFGALLLGENLEAVAILIFYQTGELCQQVAVEKSRGAIKNLVGMSVKSVNKYADDGHLAQVPPEHVAVGDRLLVKAGEKVALDGVALNPAVLDTSAITGESVPVEVGTGGPVYSGSVNVRDVFTEEVRKRYDESTIARIVSMVENASAKKARSEQFVTRFSRVYTPVVVALAFLIAIPFPLIFGWSLTSWIHTGMILLIVSCPCALVLSIPMSFFGGIGAAGKRGILLKGGNYLESLAFCDTVVFDKTGTLTRGVFEVAGLFPAPNVSADALLETAAWAESQSTHPIARGVTEKYGRPIDHALIRDYKEYGGHGVSARIAGRRVLCGNAALMREHGVANVAEPDLFGTHVYAAADGVFLGCLVLTDIVKEDAAEAVADLKTLGVRRTVMLTGDKRAAAEDAARRIGIDEAHCELTPEQKLEILDRIIAGKAGRGKTAFVGEGINDVPAIARADVGISMGALGSDAAMEAANVVLMTDEPAKLPMAMRLARKTRQIVFVNIVFTLFVKVVVMALSFTLQALNLLPPNFILIAEFADVGVALIAILYAMTILRYNPVARSSKRAAHAHE